MANEQELTGEKSLEIIQQMISKARNSYHDSGLGPLLWGTVITVCSLVTFFEIRTGYKLPFDIWLLTLVAVVPQVFIVIKERKLNKVRPYDETMMDYVWTCFGISIFLLIFINANVLNKLNPVFQTYVDVKGTRPEFNFSSFIASYFLLLYGIPTIITGGCRKFSPMLYGGILCWVCCIVSVFTKGDVDMLLTALSAIGAWLVPGIILRQRHLKRMKENV